MKFKPSWVFWLLVVLSYNGKGLTGVVRLLMIFGALILLNLIVWSFTSDFRSYLIKEKGFKADGKFLQLCCNWGLHTWGEVVEDKPKTEIGEHYLKVYHLRFGERKSLCCGKMQVVDSPADGKSWHKLDEKYHGLRWDCQQ